MTPPDSGEREVRINIAEVRRFWAAAVAADSETAKEVMRMCDELERRRAGVLLDRFLAQRILAALDAAAADYERLKVYGATPIRAVAAELRAQLPQEPK